MQTITEDYTILETGTAIFGAGSVERCSCCGRNGLREHLAGQDAIIHTEVSELMSDGLLVVPGDCCFCAQEPSRLPRA